MSEFELQPQQLPMDEPQTSSVLKNVKEIKFASGEITMDGPEKTIKIGKETSILLDGKNGRMDFTQGASSGSIIMDINPFDSSVNLILTSATSTYFFDTSDNYMGRIFRDSAISYGLELNGGSYIAFTSGSVFHDTGALLDLDRTLRVAGDVTLTAGKKFQVGTGALTAGIDYSNASVNTFSINIVGGIVTQFTKNS